MLEKLFDLPATERTAERAAEMAEPAWEELVSAEPELAAMFDDSHEQGRDVARWLASCRGVLHRYFTLEDPQRIEPAAREQYVEALLDSRLLLRGFVDRVDVAPDGRVRVVDYKSGRSPGPGFEGRALFQMKFYALVWWRTHGVVPTVLQLVYLGDGEVVRYTPDEADLRATARKVEAIRRAEESGDWRPSPGGLCRRCAFQELCPEYGGTPPPLPDPRTVESAPSDRQ